MSQGLTLLSISKENTGLIAIHLSALDICHLEETGKAVKGWVVAGKMWEFCMRVQTGLLQLLSGCTSWRELAVQQKVVERNLEAGRYKVIPLDKKLDPYVIPLELKVKGKTYLATVLQDYRSVTIWNPLNKDTVGTFSLPETLEGEIARLHLLGSKQDPQGILAQLSLRDVRGMPRLTNEPLPIYGWDLQGNACDQLIANLQKASISCFEPLGSKSRVLATACDSALYIWDIQGRSEEVGTFDSAIRSIAAWASEDGSNCCLAALDGEAEAKGWRTKDGLKWDLWADMPRKKNWQQHTQSYLLLGCSQEFSGLELKRSSSPSFVK